MRARGDILLLMQRPGEGFDAVGLVGRRGNATSSVIDAHRQGVVSDSNGMQFYRSEKAAISKLSREVPYLIPGVSSAWVNHATRLAKIRVLKRPAGSFHAISPT